MGVGRGFILLTVYYSEYHVFGYICSLKYFVHIYRSQQAKGSSDSESERDED